MRAPRLVSIAVLSASLLAAGCGSKPDEGGGEGAVRAVATTTQVGDLVRQVGGDRVAVTQILQPNSDPHDYEPRPSDARAIEEADVVFRSGGEVDEWMGDLFEANKSDGGSVDLIESVRPREGGEHHHDDEHGEEEEHEEGDTDPHWWQNPRNAEAAVAAIRDQLSKADPGGRAGYEKRAAAYTRQLRALDRQVTACIGRLRPAERKLVTSHDALGYYTDRYGLAVAGAVIPSLSTQAQPSSKAVNRLADTIKRERVKAIFPESSLNPKIEKALARESGARVGGALWADTLGPKGSKGGTYIGSIRDNTNTIVRALSGGTERCP